ncbi:MAG: FtsX-like permease family protein [Candidatus Omnitrophota bacterium]|nr:MAG: FtsX-like permease family protein [Candidatus Omnitrophota bacterium]
MSRLFLRKLLRDMKTRKGSLLALLAIVTIGVGVYIGFAAVYRDLDGSRERYYRDYRLADFTVYLKRAPAWSVQETAMLANVREARGRVQQSVLIEVPHQLKPISGTAISMPLRREPVLNDIFLRSGMWFSDNDKREVIIDDAFAKAHRLQPGSRIKVLLLDKQHDLLVVGTAMSPEFVYLIPPGGGFTPDAENYGVLYLPEKFLQESSDLDGAYNQIIGSVHDDSPPILNFTLRVIENRLEAYGVTQSLAARDQASVRFLEDELVGVKISSRISPTIFLLVAALVMNVLIGRMVAQQRTVIGTLKALGYSTSMVTRHYLNYGLFIGIVGGVTGTLFGFWMQNVFVQMYRQFFALPEINAHFYFDILATGFLISIGFALVGTLKGVRYAVSLEPAEAMRPPPPEKGGKVLPERITVFWRILSFRQRMVLRAVFRNPFRSGVNVTASLISTALIVMTLCNTDALDSLMSFEFEKTAHQDMTISLRDPVGIRVQTDFQQLPGVSETEPQLLVVCDLSNGPFEKRAGVMGLVRNNRLYTPIDEQNRRIAVPESGLLLTKKLAELLHVSRGDTIRLRPLIARREIVYSPVVGIVDSYLGLSAYADIRYLSRLLGEEWAANTMLFTSFRKTYDPAFLRELTMRPVVVGINERLQALHKIDEVFGQSMGIMIFVMVLFAGMIAFGSVLNSALVSLSEREREVGTLRVLGYTPAQISGIFSGESFLLNGMGIFFGVFAGMGLVHLLSMAYSTELYRFPVVIYFSRLLESAFLMCLFISLAQWIVFRMVRKLNWLDALKVKE